MCTILLRNNFVGPIAFLIYESTLPYHFRIILKLFQDLFFYDWRGARDWAAYKMKRFICGVDRSELRIIKSYRILEDFRCFRDIDPLWFDGKCPLCGEQATEVLKLIPTKKELVAYPSITIFVKCKCGFCWTISQITCHGV